MGLRKGIFFVFTTVLLFYIPSMKQCYASQYCESSDLLLILQQIHIYHKLLISPSYFLTQQQGRAQQAQVLPSPQSVPFVYPEFYVSNSHLSLSLM